MTSVRRLPKSLQAPKYTSYWDLSQAESPTINDINYLIEQVGPPRTETEMQFVSIVFNKMLSNIMVRLVGSQEEKNQTILYLRSKFDEIESQSTQLATTEPGLYVNYDLQKNLSVKKQKR